MARSAYRAARVAAETAELLARARVATDERDALRSYAPLFDELDMLISRGTTARASVFLLRLHGDTALEALRVAITRRLGDAVELRPHVLASGEMVVLLLVPVAQAAEIERDLADARVERAPLPAGLANAPLADALPQLRPRLAQLDRELAAIHDRAIALAADHGFALTSTRRWCHDALLAQDAEDHAGASAHAFVLEGWLPARDLPALTRALEETVGREVVIEEVARNAWHGEDAPVVLSNPPLFRPFEALTSFLPLPRYGSVDPTPFVAVFFPMLFGVIAGDVGYGLAIAALAIVLRLVRPRARDLARIAGAVAFYTIVFGFLYGELFGDLGTRWFGMRALWFDRQQAVLAFLVLAIGIGLVHLVLGLLISATVRWRHDKREALGRGLTALVLLLVALALAALFDRAPEILAAPAAIAALVALPIIVILEGAAALFDVMTLFGHVLSYARVMALGTASVMLAVVANRMYGAFGSAAVGIAFGLVFHLVNLAITLFSPTIQVMRLHFVEFFDTFFEPGGGPYRPLRHWRPS